MAFLAGDSVAAFFAEGRDLVLIEWLWKFLILSAVLMPFGAYLDGKLKVNSVWGRLRSYKASARIGWFFQDRDLPAFAVPIFLVLIYGGRYVGEANPNIVLVGMFLLHYTQRVSLYSADMNSSPTPNKVYVVGCLFCLLNGYMQGRYLTNFASYDTSWFYDPRFVVGCLVFLFGMAINIQADMLLKSLRKPGETGYKIPRDGMFDYVSAANYFGESVEWTGYAIACWNPPAFAYAVFVVIYLGSRARQYHRFYLEKFEDYPRNRKAFIPFIL